MVKYYDKSRNKLFELPNFKIDSNHISNTSRFGGIGGMSYGLPSSATVTFNSSKFDVNYIQDMVSEIYSPTTGELGHKSDYMRNIFILNDDDTIIEFQGCILITTSYDETQQYELEFSVDYHKYHVEDSDLRYAIIQESRRIKLDDLLD